MFVSCANKLTYFTFTSHFYIAVAMVTVNFEKSYDKFPRSAETNVVN